MKITNQQALNIIQGVQRCLAYEHPVSKSGVRQPMSLALVKLLQTLEENVVLVQNEQLKLFQRAGAVQHGNGLAISTDSPHYQTTVAEVAALMNVEFEVGDQILLKDLVCRDEKGEYVPIEPVGDTWRLLGPLLSL